MTKRYINSVEMFSNISNEEQCNRMDSVKQRIDSFLRPTGLHRSARLAKFFEDHYLEVYFRSTNYDGDRECESTKVTARRYDSDNFREELSSSYMPHCILSMANEEKPTKKLTGKVSEKMNNVKEAAKVTGANILTGNKEALGMATKLQAGRANNKVIKEAVRPLVKLMFKPSFMQRLLAKIFKVENPIDKFLDSPYGGMFAAQVAQAVVAAKGVENEKVKAVVVGGIAYSLNELGDELIPVDKAIDSVVETLTATADKLIK